MKPAELGKMAVGALMRPRRIAALGVLARHQWRRTRGVDDAWFSVLDRLHVHHSVEVDAAARAIAEVVAAHPLPTPPADAPAALVMAFRGQWPSHIVQHYLVALSLAELGFAPRVVLCGGAVERCGMTQTRLPFEVPPIPCSACRCGVAAIADSVAGTITLSDVHAGCRSDGAVEEAEAELPDNFEGLIGPALLRHFQGDADAPLRTAEIACYAQAGRRYLARFRKVLDQTSARAVVLFNGMFFPECLLADECRRRGVALLHLERGVLPNSLFLSGREAACHYRSEALWQELQDAIPADDVRRAVTFVESRRTKNIDPLGNDRGFAAASAGQNDRLGAEPYAIFFSPVLHDTAAMGKEGPFGDPLTSLSALCDAAERTGVRLVVRAHPDERKLPNPAEFTIRDFLEQTGRLRSSRVLLLDSTETWNPYRLAENARLVVTFNGTIGMECPVLGIPIVNLGTSHYIGKGFTIEPASQGDLDSLMLDGPPQISSHERNAAARYLAFYLYHATLPTDAWIRELPHGMCAASAPTPAAGIQLGRVRDRVGFLLRGQGIVR